MPDSDPDPSLPELPAELEGLNPGDLLARGLKSNRPPTGASGWVPPTPEELAGLLPQYQIESLLGHGGMGAVYKGLQPALDRAVAIKLLPAEMANDEQFISRFQREARTLAKLHHPSIVAVHDFGRTSAGHLYFVMEYIDGMDLRRVLRTSGLPPDDALKVIVQICDALQAAHKQGVVHRDIKPENILITHEGYVKLVDFGIARPMNEEFGRLTVSGMMVGTPDYMSPEQRTGDVDERTDIYALGVVLYELLTGRPPRGVFPAPSRRVQIDVRIDEVVLKALQDDPEARYQNVSDMKTDVVRIRSTSPPVGQAPIAAAPPPAPPPPLIISVATRLAPLYRKHKKQAAWGAGALVVFFLILLLSHQLGKARRDASQLPGVAMVPGSAPTSPSDAVQPNTVWSTGAGETLTILERKGEWFKGRYQANFDNVLREMTGTVKGNQIFWLSRDTAVLRGYGSGDCYGTFDGDKFYLNSYNDDGTVHSTFYHVRPGKNPLFGKADLPPPANWRIPGLNEADFGGWSAFGPAQLETRDGILTLTSQGGWVGILSGKGDFSRQDLHVELAGSPDVQAWIGFRIIGGKSDWGGYTSYVNGHEGQVATGHAGRNFAATSEAGAPKHEEGLGRVDIPAGEFFSWTSG